MVQKRNITILEYRFDKELLPRLLYNSDNNNNNNRCEDQ